MGILKNTKGDLTDMISFTVWVVVLAIGVTALVYAFLQMSDPLKDTALGDDPDTLSAINSFDNYVSLALPGAHLIVFFGLILGIMISSFFVKEHPIFIVVYILFAIPSIIVAVSLGNVWGNLKDLDSFQSVLELNTVASLMDTIVSNIVLISVVVFILSIIIVFAKPGGSQSAGSQMPI